MCNNQFLCCGQNKKGGGKGSERERESKPLLFGGGGEKKKGGNSAPPNSFFRPSLSISNFSMCCTRQEVQRCIACSLVDNVFYCLLFLVHALSVDYLGASGFVVIVLLCFSKFHIQCSLFIYTCIKCTYI